MNYQKSPTEAFGTSAEPIDPLPKWKRWFDVVGAMTSLVLLSPLLLSIALFIKLSSRGPVLFRHQRYGFEGKPLHVWKFRSMQVDTDPLRHQRHVISMAHDDGQLTKLNHDADLIPLGKWLRCSALDELPQLFNVLQGDMSLVGPRPDVVPLEQYQEWQRVRFAVLPGLTGLWQVSGKNETTFNEMNQLDAIYVQNRSPWLDTKIIVWTIPAVIKQVAENYFSNRAES